MASRAQTVEAVSGLMNVVMLPMWILSGVFFSAQRFPDALQPFIKALPLTAAIEALRANMLQGAGLRRWRHKWACWARGRLCVLRWRSSCSDGGKLPLAEIILKSQRNMEPAARSCILICG